MSRNHEEEEPGQVDRPAPEETGDADDPSREEEAGSGSPDPGVDPDTADADVQELEVDREAELAAQVLALRDQLLRAVAEQENLRKRTEREKEQTRRFGIAAFARDLLSTADNLRRALEATPDSLEDADEWVRNMVVGVEMTERDLLAAMEKNGISRVDPAGEKFDYNLHQAMFEVTDSGQEAGTVIQVLQPGYVLGDRLLRAAMVGVAKDPPPPAEAAGEDVPAEDEDTAGEDADC
ncbi:MAG: nucleotide exchange factor GrpE [Alphaproteobacteria bacterium]|nr:nucleotide exchange factor GrpE [Alphaproteobacteria bacterium]